MPIFVALHNNLNRATGDVTAPPDALIAAVLVVAALWLLAWWINRCGA